MQSKVEMATIKHENPAAHKSITDRAEAAGKVARWTNKIRATYPHRWEPIRIRMKSGVELATGFQTALAALLRGDAELIAPPAKAGTQSLHGNPHPEIITLD